jgi:hypothetical protein
MKRRIYTLLITLILCLGALPIFGSCSSMVDLLEDYDVIVTYYFNGGTMETYENCTSLDVYYKSGSPIVEPKKSSSLKPVTLSGYYAEGWYYAELNEDGTVKTDEKGNPYASTKQFNFDTERPTESLTLVVKWGSSIRVVFKNLTIGSSDYKKDIDESTLLTQPGITTVGSGADKKTIYGYYWADQTDGVYPADQAVNFGNGISLSELRAHLSDDPEKDGNYTVLYIYVDAH